MKKRFGLGSCAAIILVLGFLVQQEATAAGSPQGEFWSQAYSVLSANVGSTNPFKKDIGFKLQESKPNSPSPQEEAVKNGIKGLKPLPDVLILIELSNREQACRICEATGEKYEVYRAQKNPDDTNRHDHDFICIKRGIIALNHQDKPDVVEADEPKEMDQNIVSYVDVTFNEDPGLKVRLFYVHFPSPGGHFDEAENKAHEEAMRWIQYKLTTRTPCLIAGDFNNDFVRELGDWNIPSATYISNAIQIHNLSIFNRRVLDSYEPTYLLKPSTIDWVIGNERVKSDLPFISPVATMWWVSWLPSSLLNFDHKPLYGLVRFRYTPTKWPFDPILVIDRSGSIQNVSGLMGQIQNDAGTFVDRLLQQTRKVSVINFSGRGEARTDCSFSSDRGQILRAIEQPSIRGGGTALVDAVIGAINQAPAQGKTALIVFSDGCENSSAHSLEEAMKRAQERSIPVLTVGYLGDQGGGNMQRNEELLRALATQTGAWYEGAENLNVYEMIDRFGSYLKYKDESTPVGPPD